MTCECCGQSPVERPVGYQTPGTDDLHIYCGGCYYSHHPYRQGWKPCKKVEAA